MKTPRLKCASLLALFSLGTFIAEDAQSAESNVAADLAAIIEVADAQLKEGSSGLEEVLKVHLAVNFAKYKCEVISREDLRRLNQPLEKKLISYVHSAYKKKAISSDEVVATIDFISSRR